MIEKRVWLLALGLVLVTSGCSKDKGSPAPAPPQDQPAEIVTQTPVAPPAVAAVDAARLLNAESEPGSWMSYGRTYSEQRYSPLKQVNAGNVGELGLAWSFDFDTARGIEATSIVVDGVMYTTSSWSIVHALDARTGKHLWTYDPEVDKAKSKHGCCDVVNRGVAVWHDGSRVRRCTLDGSPDCAGPAASGEVRWEDRYAD